MEQNRPAFQLNLLLSVVTLILLSLVFFAYTWSGTKLEQSYQQRYQSYLLADELRQSSDDLTRLGRTYVITKDPAYEQQYMRILAIRNGEQNRPEGYNRIYWDFVAASGQNPRPDTSLRRGLIDLMKDAGFTDGELAKLNEAKNNSDALVSTEVAAFKLVQQQEGDLAVNQQKAIAMMHDKAYHQNKGRIMAPIDDFYVMMETRTQQAVDDATSQSAMLRYLFIALGLVLMFFLWRTYRALLDLTGTSVSQLRSDLNSLAQGDFSRQIQVPVGAQESLIGLLATMQSTLKGIIAQVSHSSEELSGSADSIAQIAEQTAQFATSQQTSTQTMAAAIEELVVSISHLSDNATHADELSKVSANTLEEGSGVIKQTLDSIENISSTVGDAASSLSELNSHTQQISDIIEVIRDIADQTNLLALNAAIEAARAGEQGRGFAVVADEVRNLASRSAASTQQITGMISKIQSGADASIRSMENTVNNVSRGVSLANQTGEAIISIKSHAANLTGLMGEISHTLREQSTAANEVVSTVGHITSLSEQSGDAARHVSQEAAKLKQLSRLLRQEMGRFKL
ncbi:TPA: methyl-accepting chemotaxis protein [Aeromonas salmonicida subsp. salmonicida]|uniref:methyl-accepting chemotaxis protein n=1 Tax=Aeromonas salmonicida TaxID=645 RepID=UPI00131F7A08|nr:methyl-accepting chemotaxis protein [Aeromonas salmonicida]ELI6419143.1 methyl-accepting chemotaxis protein [Aeromonas salmonicida subsp. salmonicida]ELM3647563.1 methyl-accepting chemotaxis protein [Aeromonas salmonicida subsp. salmonicida]QHE45388.1 methyl-accepting chemotaxis protein [Aeromonas salmonicida subsp. salmonicida]QHE47194.1 methyl-accepting chemotaxis protein [Aeromonas salmonicida subsp. salmonicida]QJF54944.1 methyl-accepting chemotaxis protein [Aeromonas salmonicida subsp.